METAGIEPAATTLARRVRSHSCRPPGGRPAAGCRAAVREHTRAHANPSRCSRLGVHAVEFSTGKHVHPQVVQAGTAGAEPAFCPGWSRAGYALADPYVNENRPLRGLPLRAVPGLGLWVLSRNLPARLAVTRGRARLRERQARVPFVSLEADLPESHEPFPSAVIKYCTPVSARKHSYYSGAAGPASVVPPLEPRRWCSQSARNSRVRLGQPPAASRSRAGQHRGGVQVLDPPSPGELVHVGGDAVNDRPHPREIDGHDGPVRPIGGRAQVDRWRVAVSIQVGIGHELVPARVTARPPQPGCGSRSLPRGPRPAPTSVPVRPAPAAMPPARPASGPAAPAGLPRSAR